MIDLKKFIEICEINDIEYKIFFGPVYKSLLIRNKNEYLLRELFIIEQLFQKISWTKFITLIIVNIVKILEILRKI